MKSQTILITGATSGIGRHAALALAAQGHRVFATGRRTDALEALKAEAGDRPLEILRLDVNDEASIAAAKAEVDVRTGMIRSSFEDTAGADIGAYDDDPAYGPAVRTWTSEGAKMYKKAPGPEPVTRTIIRIVAARRPRARYVSPARNLVMMWMMKILPTSWADAIFRRVAGL